MPKKILYIIILICAFIFTGCVKDTGPIVIRVDTTPQRENVTATPTPSPTPEPTPEELFGYIEDLELSDSDKNIFFSGWPFGNNGMPFTVNGQLYNKGIGMYVSSKSITNKYKTDKYTWNIDRNYHKLSFDLGVEQQLQYGSTDKYGTFQVQIYIDDTMVWDSGVHDFEYTSINTEVNIPEGGRKLAIILTQSKGLNGTLNIALAGFKLYYFQ